MAEFSPTMKRQFRNRYLEAAVILICSNPIEVFKFAVARIIGKQWPCRLNFRGFRLLLRPNSPDLRVVRSVLLGAVGGGNAACPPKI